MKTLSKLALALALVLLAAGAAWAADAPGPVTLSGKVACAHCTLKLAGVTQCQDVLVVEKEGQPTYYYVVKNDVAKKFGHVCNGQKAAVVTGTLSEKDGKTWIEPTKMEAQG